MTSARGAGAGAERAGETLAPFEEAPTDYIAAPWDACTTRESGSELLPCLVHSPAFGQCPVLAKCLVLSTFPTHCHGDLKE